MEHWAWLVFGLESVQIFPNMVSDFIGLIKPGSICHKNGFLIHPLRLLLGSLILVDFTPPNGMQVCNIAQYFNQNRNYTTHANFQSPGDNKFNLKSRNRD